MTTELINQRPKEVEKLEVLRAEINLVCDAALKQKVFDTSSKDSALSMGAQVKRMRKALDDRRKELTAPLQDTVKKVIAFANGLDNPLERAEAHIRVQATSYAVKIADEKRVEAQAIEAERQRIRDEEDALKRASSVVSDTTDEHLANVASIDSQVKDQRIAVSDQERQMKREMVKGTREVWTYQITDVTQIPDQFWVIDEQAIRAAILRLHIRDIPGVRIYSETKVSLSSY